MDREDYGRLVRVETTVEALHVRVDELRDDLREHRQQSEARHEALKGMVEQLHTKLDAPRPSPSVLAKLANPDTVRLVAYVVLSLAGAAGAASALFK